MKNNIVDLQEPMRDCFISVNNEFRRLGESLCLTFQEVNVGKQPNDSTGDSLRVARDKIEHNFNTLGRHLGIELLSMPEFEPMEYRVNKVKLGNNNYTPDIMQDCFISGAVLRAANINFASLQHHPDTKE